MSKIIRLTVDIEPVAKGRPKITFRQGHVWTYNPVKTQNYEEELKWHFMKHKDKCFDAGIPVKLSITFFRTKSKFLPLREVMPFRKPDTDNFLKAALDSMNGILVADDSQICTIIAKKRWTDKEAGYITIRLEKDTYDFAL